MPKYRGDLVACAAVTRAMRESKIESSRYPRNPLDVLAQQIVAMVAMDDWDVDALFAAVRRAAPFAELARGIFEGVLDMLSGRYPSDEFADLRPRLTWDRVANTLTAREGAKRVAVINGGTIPDRGLYGVFLLGERGPGARVGELDEEMVFESRVGETFLLGRVDLAHRGDHARPRAGHAGAGRAGQDAVLEGRCRRPAARARHVHRRRWSARSGSCRRPARSSGWCSTTISTPAPPRTCCATSPIRPRPPASSPTIARS